MGFNSSNDIVNSNEEFSKQKNSKILGGAAISSGSLNIGPVSTSFSYLDDAGRSYSTTSNHTVPNTSKTENVPASVFPQTILNVGARFSR